MISVGPLAADALDSADHIFRVAFGTYLGHPDPPTFMGDADYIRTRWRADPAAAFGAYIDDVLVGSNFAANWGSVAFFGPLTIRPDFWDQGVAKRLMEPVIGKFDEWRTRVAGLYTFPNSPKHIGLYQRFGFWPRFLTAMMSKPPEPSADAMRNCTRFSDVPTYEREQTIATCREMTGAMYDGLDLSIEIRSVADQRLGDTVCVWREDGLAALAVCHAGSGTEAGGGACYVKFGGVRPSRTAREDFDRLLQACERLAADAGAARLRVGVNTGRQEAYGRLIERGFRTDTHGVIMHRPNVPAYDRPGIYALDDWR